MFQIVGPGGLVGEVLGGRMGCGIAGPGRMIGEVFGRGMGLGGEDFGPAEALPGGEDREKAPGTGGFGAGIGQRDKR